MDVNYTGLDLNRDPEEPNSPRVSRLTPLASEEESAQDRVEERIRQLGAVVVRARLLQRWRESRNNIESTYISSESNLAPVDRSEVRVNRSVQLSDRTRETGIGLGCKRDSSHLISNALDIGGEAKIGKKESGSFFDCNICWELAKDPVLTTCGHLFCWACFYQVAKFNSEDKECPVCRGRVSDDTVIPIYGNSGDGNVCEGTKSGLNIPPRPKGQRIESARQQSASEFAATHGHILQAIRGIRTLFANASNEIPEEEHDEFFLRALRWITTSMRNETGQGDHNEHSMSNSGLSRNSVQSMPVHGLNSNEYMNDSTTHSITNHLPDLNESVTLPNPSHVLSVRGSSNSIPEVAPSSSSPVRRRTVTQDPREARRRLN